ncbi:MAG: helix-turn-helix domain-containing protein [Actinoallomurus sp.]
MPKPIGPTIARWQLGKELQRLRTSADVVYDQVAEMLGCSESKVRKIESGVVGVARVELLAMLDLYGLDDNAARDALMDLAKQGKQRGWWVGYGRLPNPYTMYLGLESAATAVRSFQLAVVPGMLQTEGYARAVNAATLPGTSEEEVERRVKVRLARQEQQLTGEDPPEYWAILDEAAVRRVMGGPAVMRGQLDRLLELGELPQVTLQVLPFAHGGHAGTLGAFTVLEFPEDIHSPVVYTEGMVGDVYMESEADLRRCYLAYSHLSAAALSDKESRKLIKTISKELT